MGKNYKQLRLEERYRIAHLQAEGRSIRQIAAIMDRSASTISRELIRNRGANYKPSYADEQAWARRWRGSRLERQPSLQKHVVDRLVMGWSPQQIAGRLKLDDSNILISHESIYRFIYVQYARTKDKAWRLLLPRAKFKRGFRGRKGGNPANFIKHRVSIAQRPRHIDSRKQPSHWESDLLMFSDKLHNVLVSQERASRFVILTAQSNKKAQTIINNQLKSFAKFPAELRRTLTLDNGTEFSHHYELTNNLNMKTFFCNPHSPWQKGGVENINGRLRRYLPRNTDISSISDSDLQLLQLQINSTPRKCLAYKTPLEVMYSQLLHFKCESTSPRKRG